MAVRKGEETGIEGGSTKINSMENSLWKRLLTCSKTDHKINECEVLKNLLELTETS